MTDNIRHFPANVLEPFGIEEKGADVFIADTIDLDIGRIVLDIQTIRKRFIGPNQASEEL